MHRPVCTDGRFPVHMSRRWPSRPIYWTFIVDEHAMPYPSTRQPCWPPSLQTRRTPSWTSSRVPRHDADSRPGMDRHMRPALMLPLMLMGLLLGGCEQRQPTQADAPAAPARLVSSSGTGKASREGTRVVPVQSAATGTRPAPTDKAAGGVQPDEGALVLPSDPPVSDNPAPSSRTAGDVPLSHMQAQNRASATSAAIDDATALRLLKSNHCMSCHQLERKVVGPAFRDIGRRHAGQPDAGRQLATSILRGGSRNWGPVPMPPQPHVNDRDLKVIVDWILQQR